MPRPQSSDNSYIALSSICPWPRLWLWPYGSMATGPYGSGLWVATLLLARGQRARLRPWPCYGYGYAIAIVIAMVVSVAVAMARRLCEGERQEHGRWDSCLSYCA